MSNESFTYKQAGVDIDEKYKTFDQIDEIVSKTGNRVLNRMGAYASLIDFDFPEMEKPTLVFKLEEPGTKQKLALQHGSLNSVAHDMINHLVNDIMMMGARPLAVQDLIVCGKLKSEIITPFIKSASDACKNNGCMLVGGETSEQPGVVEESTHILGASIVGVVDQKNIIDGSQIKAGDTLLAVESSGLHTNGYSLVRKLLATYTDLAQRPCAGMSFIEAALVPHRTYFQPLTDLFKTNVFSGLAHITGGGIEGNLGRVIPSGLTAEVDLSQIKIQEIFRIIREVGNVPDQDLLRTFNLGVGIITVQSSADTEKVSSHFNALNYKTYPIGKIRSIKANESEVTFINQLKW